MQDIDRIFNFFTALSISALLLILYLNYVPRLKDVVEQGKGRVGEIAWRAVLYTRPYAAVVLIIVLPVFVFTTGLLGIGGPVSIYYVVGFWVAVVYLVLLFYLVALDFVLGKAKAHGASGLRTVGIAFLLFFFSLAPLLAWFGVLFKTL